MAVAGNTLDVIMLRVDGGKLTQVGGKHRIAGHLACDPAKAIRELRAGRSCCLKLYGDNKAQVEAAFAVEGKPCPELVEGGNS